MITWVILCHCTNKTHATCRISLRTVLMFVFLFLLHSWVGRPLLARTGFGRRDQMGKGHISLWPSFSQAAEVYHVALQQELSCPQLNVTRATWWWVTVNVTDCTTLHYVCSASLYTPQTLDPWMFLLERSQVTSYLYKLL